MFPLWDGATSLLIIFDFSYSALLYLGWLTRKQGVRVALVVFLQMIRFPLGGFLISSLWYADLIFHVTILIFHF